MKIRAVLTHLSGAIVTYLMVASCSTSGDAPGASFTFDAAVGASGHQSGGMEGGAFMPDGAPTATSGAGNIDSGSSNTDSGPRYTNSGPHNTAGAPSGLDPQDASTILDAWLSPVPDANAQSCGSCEIPSPLQLKTADTDAAQLIGGQFLTPIAAGGYVGEAFATGPAVVTDLMTMGGGAINRGASIHLIAQAAACDSSFVDLNAILVIPSGESRSGLRIFVPAGSRLCAIASGTPTTHRLALYWSGYKPY